MVTKEKAIETISEIYDCSECVARALYSSYCKCGEENEILDLVTEYLSSNSIESDNNNGIGV
jgi:hypothetical protein